MKGPLHVVVLGYGTPRTMDDNQRRYVTGCIETIEQTRGIQRQNFKQEVYFTFVGGFTNRPNRSEADSLREAFQQVLGSAELQFAIINDTLSARENITSVAQQYKQWNLPGITPVQIFCEASRVPTIQMFVDELWHRHHGHPVVDGIEFDPDSLTWWTRFKQKYIHCTIEYLALKIGGPFKWLRRWGRERTLKKARKQAQLEDEAAEEMKS